MSPKGNKKVPKPSNKSTVDIDLAEAIQQKDSQHVDKENTVILELVTGRSKHKTEDDENNNEDESSSEEEYQPAKKKSKDRDNQATNFLSQLLSQQPLTQGKKQAKTINIKAPLGMCT